MKILLLAIFILVYISSVSAQEKGTFTDARDGKVYKTVKIGTQTWMAENLAYKANNGCWAYNNNVENNAKKYGYLYNWEMAKNVCPSGWHLPTDAEWTTLTDYLGGDSIAGGKLKETGTTHWKYPNFDATNVSGFTALPGDHRNSNGIFGGIKEYGHWWSSTKYDTDDVWYRYIFHYYCSVIRDHGGKKEAISVRCIKDK